MPTIDKDQDIFTVIVRYDVEPQHFEELVGLMQDSIGTFAQVAGFVGSSLHTAHDQSHALTYLQWESEQAHQACFQDPIWASKGAAMMEFVQSGKAQMSVATYDVRSS